MRNRHNPCFYPNRNPQVRLYQACTWQPCCRQNLPAWYVILDGDRIIAGLGVIDNDFHKRPDLTPNLCALYVEREYRMRGLARRLLDHACRELGAHGCTDAYLITDHTSLYERCGWSFFTMVEENCGGMIRMYHRAIQKS